MYYFYYIKKASIRENNPEILDLREFCKVIQLTQ